MGGGSREEAGKHLKCESGEEEEEEGSSQLQQHRLAVRGGTARLTAHFVRTYTLNVHARPYALKTCSHLPYCVTLHL